ncbi:MAG: DUF11 domain-containing protein [Thermoflexales bacterium]|nr:DUF11 domain-containing protein [Thermoflexales bacterium]
MRRTRVLVLLGILLVVGGAVYLLTHLPALAYIRYAEHTRIDEFNLGKFYHTGMTRREDGEVTLLSLGIAGEWVSAPITGLPPLYGHAMIQRNGYVYVIGGVTGWTSQVVLTRSVYVSRINTQTNFLEPFELTTPLPPLAYPLGVYDHSAVVVSDCLYVVGGRDPAENASRAVVFARFNPDGTLGDWQTAEAQLPVPRARVPAVEINGFIYLAGGQHVQGGGGTDVVLYTRPTSPTGQISEWLTATARLPYPSFGHMVAAYEGRLYRVGGYYPAPLPKGGAKPEVHYVTPTLSGDIVPPGWITTVLMPDSLVGGDLLAFNGELVILGGMPNYPLSITPTAQARAALVDIESGKIITDEEIVPNGWFEAPALSRPLAWHKAVLGPGNEYIYVLGGTDGGDQPLPIQSTFNRGRTTGMETGAVFARSGWYLGPTIELGRERKVLEFDWTVELPDPSTSLDLEYRTQTIAGNWSSWIVPASQSASAGSKITYTVPFTDASAFRFEYRLWLTTTKPLSYTPSFHRFRLEYDVAEPPRFEKIASPPSGQGVLPYQHITYTLPFSNPNIYELKNVVILDTLPEFLTYLPGSMTATGGDGFAIVPDDSDLPRLRWRIAELPSGGSGQVSYIAVVSSTAPEGTWLENKAEFRSDNTDPKSSVALHPVVGSIKSPQLAKMAEPSPGPVLPGQSITYTLAYSNPPNNMLMKVVISDVLPAGLSLISCDPDCQQLGSELRWAIDELPSPGEGQVSFAARVDAGALNGTLITNTGYLGACVVGYPSCTPLQTSDPIVHQVVAPLSPQIDKSASPPSGAAVSPGAHISYTLAYTHSAALALSVVISDALPLSTTLVSGCDAPACQQVGDVLRWQFDDVAPGQPRQLGFVVAVDPAAVDGQVISNTAYAAGCGPATCAEAVASPPATHQVRIAFAAQIDKLADPPAGARVAPGDRIAYTLVYTNLDNTALGSVVVTDALPAALSLVDASCTPPCSEGGRTITWTLGTLGAGQSGQVRFAVLVVDQAADGATISNRAYLQGSTGRVASLPVDHTVVVPYDLVVTKSDGVTRASEGDTLVYTIHYTNLVPSGLVTLTNVVITEELLLNPPTPDDWALLLSSPGWSPLGWFPNRVVHQAGTLGPGQSGSITIAARLDTTLPSDPVIGLRNRVSVGADKLHGCELNAANNVFVDADAVRGPDLALRNAYAPAKVSPNAPLRISAELVNQGVSPALSWEDVITPGLGRWLAVELYAKPAGFTPAGPPAEPRDHAGGWCNTDDVPCPSESQRMEYLYFVTSPNDYPLGAGESRSVSFKISLAQTGVYSLYLQADVGNPTDHDYGRVLEANEDNNVAFLGTITVEAGASSGYIYLPLVVKNAP